MPPRAQGPGGETQRLTSVLHVNAQIPPGLPLRKEPEGTRSSSACVNGPGRGQQEPGQKTEALGIWRTLGGLALLEGVGTGCVCQNCPGDHLKMFRVSLFPSS